MKPLAIAGVALLVSLPVLTRAVHAQEEQCFPAELLVEKARAEQPSTVVVARHTGSEAAALLGAMDLSDADEDAADADEVTVLRSAWDTDVMLLGAEDGCVVWRGRFPWSDYEHALWMAFGQPA